MARSLEDAPTVVLSKRLSDDESITLLAFPSELGVGSHTCLVYRNSALQTADVECPDGLPDYGPRHP